MLALTRYVIHEVHKEAVKEQISAEKKAPETKVEVSESLGPLDDFALKLVSSTHVSFSESTALKNTHFEPNQSNAFHTALLDYLKKDSDEKFYTYTVESLKDLKIRIEKEPFATGGYYLFTDYHFDGRRFIATVLLRKKAGINFTKQKGVIRPVDAESLNIEKIAMGFRLNHGIFISPDTDKNYIALITHQQDKLSGYFKNWVQAAGVISNDQNTKSLVQIINGIDIPKDASGKPKFETREEMKKAFYELIEQLPDKRVNIHQLSGQFYGEEKQDYIMSFAQKNGITVDPEFRRSSKIWKRLITIKAKVPGIELNVDYDRLNGNEVDVKDEIIIIHSKALADQIRQQHNEREN